MLLVGLSFTYKPKNSNDGTLDITLTNIRNNNGNIYIFIYSYENQYPYEPYKHYKVSKSNVSHGKLNARISNLALKDKYAITLIDDENNNEDLDRWLGIPHEGFGFSNNIKPFLSLPDYADLTFNFNSSKKLDVKLQYVL
jgi:uncharacterized protein (DUF2141 family)